MTPAPSWRHQWVVGRLHLLLTGPCPDDLHVFFAPLDNALDDQTVLQPDLLVDAPYPLSIVPADLLR